MGQISHLQSSFQIARQHPYQSKTPKKSSKKQTQMREAATTGSPQRRPKPGPNCGQSTPLKWLSVLRTVKWLAAVTMGSLLPKADAAATAIFDQSSSLDTLQQNNQGLEQDIPEGLPEGLSPPAESDYNNQSGFNYSGNKMDAPLINSRSEIKPKIVDQDTQQTTATQGQGPSSRQLQFDLVATIPQNRTLKGQNNPVLSWPDDPSEFTIYEDAIVGQTVTLPSYTCSKNCEKLTDQSERLILVRDSQQTDDYLFTTDYCISDTNPGANCPGSVSIIAGELALTGSFATGATLTLSGIVWQDQYQLVAFLYDSEAQVLSSKSWLLRVSTYCNLMKLDGIEVVADPDPIKYDDLVAGQLITIAAITRVSLHYETLDGDLSLYGTTIQHFSLENWDQNMCKTYLMVYSSSLSFEPATEATNGWLQQADEQDLFNTSLRVGEVVDDLTYPITASLVITLRQNWSQHEEQLVTQPFVFEIKPAFGWSLKQGSQLNSESVFSHAQAVQSISLPTLSVDAAEGGRYVHVLYLLSSEEKSVLESAGQHVSAYAENMLAISTAPTPNDIHYEANTDFSLSSFTLDSAMQLNVESGTIGFEIFTLYWLVYQPGSSGSDTFKEISWELQILIPCQAVQIVEPSSQNLRMLTSLEIPQSGVYGPESMFSHAEVDQVGLQLVAADGLLFDSSRIYPFTDSGLAECLTVTFDQTVTPTRSAPGLTVQAGTDEDVVTFSNLPQIDWSSDPQPAQVTIAITMTVVKTQLSNFDDFSYTHRLVLGSDCDQSLVELTTPELQLEPILVEAIFELGPMISLGNGQGGPPVKLKEGATVGLCSKLRFQINVNRDYNRDGLTVREFKTVVDYDAMIDIAALDASSQLPLKTPINSRYKAFNDYYESDGTLVVAKEVAWANNWLRINRVSLCNQPIMKIAHPLGDAISILPVPMFQTDQTVPQTTIDLSQVFYYLNFTVDPQVVQQGTTVETAETYSAFRTSGITSPHTQASQLSSWTQDDLKALCQPTSGVYSLIDLETNLVIDPSVQDSQWQASPSSNTYEFTCAPWSFDLSNTQVSHSARITNDDNQLSTDVRVTCSYSCSNAAGFGLEEVPYGGPVIDHGTLVYSLFADPIELFVPLIEVHCPQSSVEFVLLHEGTSISCPDSSRLETDSKVDLEAFGFVFDQSGGEGELISFYAEDFDLIGTVFSLNIRAQIAGETDVFNATSFKVQVTDPICPATQADLDRALAHLPSRAQVRANYAESESLDVSAYRSAIDLLVEENPTWVNICGAFSFKFEADASFVALDEESGLVVVSPDQSTALGLQKEAALYRVEFARQQDAFFELKIDALVDSCIVRKLTFKPDSLSVSYSIGQGLFSTEVPGLKQLPQCDYALTGLSFAEKSSDRAGFFDAVAIEAIESDGGQQYSIVMQSEDYSLLGATGNMQIKASVNGQVLDSHSLFVSIAIATEELAFSPDPDFAIPQLTCSSRDKTWSFQVPAVAPDIGEPIQVEYAPTSATQRLFQFNSQDGKLFLPASSHQEWISGPACETTESISLPFKLSSDTFGESSDSLSVNVLNTKVNITVTKQTGDYEPPVEVEKLRVEELSMTQGGKLSIIFNKPILTPQLRKIAKPTDQPSEQPSEQASAPQDVLAPTGERLLQANSTVVLDESNSFDIKEALSLKVNGDDADEQFDKHIEDVSLEKVGNRTFLIGVVFRQPSDITPELVEPDILTVKFVLPNPILDADSFESLEYEDIGYEVLLTPQFSAEMLAQNEEMASVVKAVGASVAIWQLIMLIALGKALHSMWILINTLQFFVYIQMWLLNFPPLVQIILLEFRRIALGEIMDDLDLGNKVRNLFGFPVVPKTLTNEKLGLDRLGAPDISVNFGPTLLLATLVLLLFAVLVVAIYRLSTRCSCSIKWQVRFEKIRDKILYNPLIRYTLLNALKLNIMAMVTLAFYCKDQASWESLTAAIAIFVVMIVLPVVYARVVRKNLPSLKCESMTQKYGTLYKGLYLKSRGEKSYEGEGNFAHFYMPAFMARRTLFAVITVALFKWPSLQLVAHQVITLVYLSFLASEDYGLFESATRRRVEVSSEFLGLFAATLLQVLAAYPDERAQWWIQLAFVSVLGLLMALNICYVILTVRETRTEAKHFKKVLRMRQFIFEQALEEAESKDEFKQNLREIAQLRKYERQQQEQKQRETNAATILYYVRDMEIAQDARKEEAAKKAKRAQDKAKLIKEQTQEAPRFQRPLPPKAISIVKFDEPKKILVPLNETHAADMKRGLVCYDRMPTIGIVDKYRILKKQQDDYEADQAEKARKANLQPKGRKRPGQQAPLKGESQPSKQEPISVLEEAELFVAGERRDQPISSLKQQPQPQPQLKPQVKLIEELKKFQPPSEPRISLEEIEQKAQDEAVRNDPAYLLYQMHQENDQRRNKGLPEIPIRCKNDAMATPYFDYAAIGEQEPKIQDQQPAKPRQLQGPGFKNKGYSIYIKGGDDVLTEAERELGLTGLRPREDRLQKEKLLIEHQRKFTLR